MTKNVEMISLNSTKLEFKEKMGLDESLERLKSNELRSIKAGENSCQTMCGTRCDMDGCMPVCAWDSCGFQDGCQHDCLIECGQEENEYCRIMDLT
ncbi:hypothetical protein [Bacteroides oleiciplenus]|uniref:Uncharacterized protein n=1 Tax=Bacteroides oleiciplenus YIT 12058 TaxID=742727 RepID=K9EI92_9BACE|nr:hypothetical protein [Bacteroides oleiciplenus]EKU90707.1 hypothetical protein HMPREF9447_02125 [Bacteroides oleiciplenus YIT 12058]